MGTNIAGHDMRLSVSPSPKDRIVLGKIAPIVCRIQSIRVSRGVIDIYVRNGSLIVPPPSCTRTRRSNPSCSICCICIIYRVTSCLIIIPSTVLSEGVFLQTQFDGLPRQIINGFIYRMHLLLVFLRIWVFY